MLRRLAERLQHSWWKSRPDALARALTPLSRLYGRLAFRERGAPSVVGVPVVVVGNLIVGGAGKTPTVIALAGLLRDAGWTPGIVSRGHGRRSEGVVEVLDDTPVQTCGDEPLLIRLRTGAPVMVGRDRVAAARELLRRHAAVDLLLCDDGLQHRALARDVEVVVFDGRGVGNGLLLPAGPLREPLPVALAPRRIVLYNAAAASTPLPGHLAIRRLAGVVPLAQWRTGRSPSAVEVLRGRRVLAAAGIAEPERFFRMLEAQGLQIERCPLPDHHAYDTLPWGPDVDVVVTEKDAVKLPHDQSTARVWVAALDFQPDPAFGAALQAALPAAPTT